MESLNIRKADEADLPAILALYRQLETSDDDVLPLDAAVEKFRRMMSYPDYTVYVAEQEGRVIGAFALLIMDNLAHRGAPAAIVEDVAVDAASQGQGIGKILMNFAREKAAGKGCYKLTLSSHLSREGAHRFYDSLGFERHGYSFLTHLSPVSDPA